MSPVHHVFFAPWGIVFAVLAVCFLVALLNSRLGQFILGLLIACGIGLAALLVVSYAWLRVEPARTDLDDREYTRTVPASYGRGVVVLKTEADGKALTKRTAKLAKPTSPVPPAGAVPSAVEHNGDSKDGDNKAAAEATAGAELAATQLAEAVEAPDSTTSAAPVATVPRPAWIGEADRSVDGEYRMHVKVGPYTTSDECRDQLDVELPAAIDRYARRRLVKEAPTRFVPSLQYIHHHLLKEEYFEQTVHEAPVGAMLNLHALLVIDRQAGAEIERQYKQAVVAERLEYAGGGAGLILGLLATLFGYLKLDTLTRGYYSGRLRLAAALVILAEAAIALKLVV